LKENGPVELGERRAGRRDWEVWKGENAVGL